MLQNLWKNRLKIAVALLLVFLLALVRIFEHALFYDPFAYYFEGDYLNLTFPEYKGWALLGSLTGRYALNAMISLAIIFVLFRDVPLTKFSAVLYGLFYVVLIVSFFALITFSGNENNFIIFYVRRFLIQPIFVLLFIPAFYYQKRSAKNNIS
ncbi:exosortase F system-associated membrane protein [Flavobacterium caeni]|uniref:Exosortase F-associated protein n=1 Tax=Flavobacterium caeni TaxID=490189 RepID=A0A1G5I347_9FLAO|nr:exosortase F system-associated protein [Flavobacterium caeni]SCY70457.1 exosortase F-associated protein [Flavobacterium caeni]